MIDEEPADIIMIKNIIKNKLVQNPNMLVSVKTDEKTKYRHYIQVLDQLKQAWGNKPAKISIAEPAK